MTVLYMLSDKGGEAASFLHDDHLPDACQFVFERMVSLAKDDVATILASQADDALRGVGREVAPLRDRRLVRLRSLPDLRHDDWFTAWARGSFAHVQWAVDFLIACDRRMHPPPLPPSRISSQVRLLYTDALGFFLSLGDKPFAVDAEHLGYKCFGMLASDSVEALCINRTLYWIAHRSLDWKGSSRRAPPAWWDKVPLEGSIYRHPLLLSHPLAGPAGGT